MTNLAQQPSAAILQGEATNHIEFTCAGDYLGVTVNGTDVGHWTSDADQAMAVVVLPRQSIHDRISVTWRDGTLR